LHPIDLSDDQKNRKRNDDEVQNGIDKDTVIQSRCAGGFGGGDTGIFFAREIDKEVRKIHFTQRQTDGRHENILDEGCHDFAECRADHHSHRQIHHISSSDELPELLDHGYPS